jgi:predicted nucleotide-binding protein
MKTLSAIFALVLTVNSFAISFITEDDVKEVLSADKVIEISRNSVKDIADNGCDPFSLMSRSGRAYIVKVGNDSFLFTTPSNLEGLKKCREI